MTILQDRNKQVFSSGILRLAGYGLLLMGLVNLLFLLLPLQLANPLWEFQTIGAIVERIPVMLVGLALIYYGEQRGRAPQEGIILKSLSWVSLLAAVGLMLTIPLNVYSSWQIYHQHNDSVSSQFVTQKETIQQFQQQLAAANSKDEIGAILQQQARQKVNIPDSINPEKLKTDIIANLQTNQDNITDQIEAFHSQKKSLLLKQCFKWSLGAIIASTIFLMIWQSTGWARLTSAHDN